MRGLQHCWRRRLFLLLRRLRRRRGPPGIGRPCCLVWLRIEDGLRLQPPRVQLRIDFRVPGRCRTLHPGVRRRAWLIWLLGQQGPRNISCRWLHMALLLLLLLLLLHARVGSGGDLNRLSAAVSRLLGCCAISGGGRQLSRALLLRCCWWRVPHSSGWWRLGRPRGPRRSRKLVRLVLWEHLPARTTTSLQLIDCLHRHCRPSNGVSTFSSHPADLDLHASRPRHCSGDGVGRAHRACALRMMTPRSAALDSSAAHTGLRPSVAADPSTHSACFARVIATFMRRTSARKPTPDLPRSARFGFKGSAVQTMHLK